MTGEGPRRYQWRGRDVPRSVFEWLEHYWPADLQPAAWQLETIERFLAAQERGARIVSMGTPMRSDGWLKRATDALRDLERQALEDLDDHRWVSGFDLASGPDRTVYVCGCGQTFPSLEGLADHAIRGHRWPPEELLR